MSSESSESLEPIERQLTGFQPSGAPRELRAAVLESVRGELRAARWDRRLARAAAMLLVIGIMLNLAIGFRPIGSHAVSQPVASTRSQSLVDAAVVVAEVTDAARSWTPDEWTRRGAHPVRGEMTVERIVAVFIADHLEEHADQLDAMAAGG